MSEPGAARRMAGCTKTNREGEREIHEEGLNCIEGEERRRGFDGGNKMENMESTKDGRKNTL